MPRSFSAGRNAVLKECLIFNGVSCSFLNEQAQGIWAPVSAPIVAGDDPKGTLVQLRGSRVASSEALARSN
jgi:hypothetical protein